MMKEKKHIDRLFSERFKDYEASPPPEVWDRIKEKLKEEEEDRKVIPIWWKLGGVAALLAILFLAGQFVFKSPESQSEPGWATEETVIEDKVDDPSSASKESTEIIADTGTEAEVDEQSNQPAQDVMADPISSDAFDETISKTVADSDSDKPTEERSAETTKPATQTVQPIVTDRAVAASAERERSDQYSDVENDTKSSNPIVEPMDSEKAVAINSDDEKAVRPNSADERSVVKDADPVIESPVEDNAIVETAIVADVAEEARTKEEVATEESGGRSIQDAIQEQQDALAQQQEPSRDDEWEVTPNLAPIYYNTLSEGSSIDPSFADNPQTGDVNLSYGVLVGYQISERLTVRSGLNNMNVGYSTGGVDIITGPVSTALRSIDYNQTGTSVVSALDSGSIPPPAPGDQNDPFENITLKSSSSEAEIVQNISYLEVPMELKYALLNKRVGINMIGGFSTLFLNNNEVSVQDGDFRSTLGEANNLNDLSFSTNIGLGFDYKFSKSFRFVLEPMFKYQLNPYTDSSVDFRPYYLGVYSGLSFKF